MLDTAALAAKLKVNLSPRHFNFILLKTTVALLNISKKARQTRFVEKIMAR